MQLVDEGFISVVEPYLKTLKIVFIASLLDAQHERNGVENKPASLLVVTSGKTLNGMPSFVSYKPMAVPSSPTLLVAQSN